MPARARWAREQDEKPYLRFSTEGQGGTDPGDNTEAVGDSDAVKATTLGIRNLQKVSEMLVKATSYKTGDPWDELEEVYGRMVGQWTTEMGHVVRVIGGIDSQQKHIGQNGVRFVTVARIAPAGSGPVPAEQRVPDAGVHDPARDPAPHPADGHHRSCQDGAGRHHGAVAPGRAARSHGRAVRARRAEGRIHAVGVPDGPADGRLVRAREAGHGIQSTGATSIGAYSEHGLAANAAGSSAEVRALVRGELKASIVTAGRAGRCGRRVDTPPPRRLPDEIRRR